MDNISKFDNDLLKIKHFRLHKNLLPFVGSEYEKYRILQVGENHYLGQHYNDEKYNIEYFWDNWWDNECTDLTEEWGERFNTRKYIIDEYLSDDKEKYMFTNIIKSFSEVMLGKELSGVVSKDKELYNNFAFMNFFQMPSIYDNIRCTKSIIESARKINKRELGDEMLEKCIRMSASIVDEVVDAIKPEIVVFTSRFATAAYKEGRGKHRDSENFIFGASPASPVSWNKPLPKFGGQTGREFFESSLRKLKK